MVEQRLHTYRTNWTLLLVLQTVSPKRETIRACLDSVKRAARGLLHRINKMGHELQDNPVNPVNHVDNNHLTKCQIPYPAAPTNKINNNASPVITSLNFR
jgi:hypothetical protein